MNQSTSGSHDEERNLDASGREDPKWLDEDGIACVPSSIVPSR